MSTAKKRYNIAKVIHSMTVVHKLCNMDPYLYQMLAYQCLKLVFVRTIVRTSIVFLPSGNFWYISLSK